MAIVCLDTNALIWGIKRQCAPGQENMIDKAKHLFQLCKDAKDTILIPSVVIGEILCGTPHLHHESILRALQETNARIVPYDLNTARFNARVWQEQRPQWEKWLELKQMTRQAVKVDVLIVATAMAQRCQVLYTQDTGVYRLAKPYLEVRYISEIVIPAQQIDFLEGE